MSWPMTSWETTRIAARMPRIIKVAFVVPLIVRRVLVAKGSGRPPVRIIEPASTVTISHRPARPEAIHSIHGRRTSGGELGGRPRPDGPGGPAIGARPGRCPAGG